MTRSIAQRFDTKSLLKITMPSTVMMMFIAVYAMFSSIFASLYIGQDALSAINIIFPLVSTVLAIAIMLSTGANAIISTNLGTGDEQKARENFTTIVIVGVITGVVLGIITYVFRYPIIHLLGSTPQLDEQSLTYLKGYIFIFPFIFLQIFGQYFFLTAGKGEFVLGISVVGGILNILICYLTMGVWNMGIIGAVIGTAVGFVVPAVAFVIFFARNKEGKLYFVRPKKHGNFILNACGNGSSEMVTNLAIAIVTATLNVVMGRLAGEDGVAAVSVLVQTKFLLNSIYIGFGGGVAPIFAYARGANDKKQIRNVYKISIRFVLITSVALVILSLLFKHQIVSAFIRPESSAYDLAIAGFTYFSFGSLFAGINIFSSVLFTSFSNGKISALISFLRTFVFTLGFLLVLSNVFGVTGVWLSTPLAEFGAMIVAIILLKKYRKTYNY